MLLGNHGLYRNGATFGSSWTPAALGSALALWLDADDASTITLNGSTVSQWNDKSGNGRNVSQATAANQPTLTASGLNGKPVLTFDGVNDYLAAASPLIGTTHSLFVLFTPTIENQTGSLFGQWSAGQTGRFTILVNQISSGAASAGFLNVFNSSSTQGGGSGGLSTEVAISNTPTLITSISTTGSEQWKLFKNGTEWDSATITSVYTGVNSAIGSLNGTESSLPFDGTVSELISFPSILSTADRERLEGYFAWKWGLVSSLPVGHPYKLIPPSL
jgi:hypothetical protein